MQSSDTAKNDVSDSFETKAFLKIFLAGRP
jgi:hypothetical protein